MKDLSTETKILEAARTVFISKGMDGARMQEIADEAGINKALLHYYYRSKDQLFRAVFQSVFAGFFQTIKGELDKEISVEQKAEAIVMQYTNMLDANPFVPQFLINEINRNPQTLRDVMESQQFNPNVFIQIFGNNNKSGFDPRQFIVSIIGMMVFPYAARNLVQLIYFQDNAEAYTQFLQERKEFLKQTILKMIQ
jgi:AcrR family transcriptional regulator